jgi:hypothetical protein
MQEGPPAFRCVPPALPDPAGSRRDEKVRRRTFSEVHAETMPVGQRAPGRGGAVSPQPSKSCGWDEPTHASPRPQHITHCRSLTDLPQNVH